MRWLGPPRLADWGTHLRLVRGTIGTENRSKRLALRSPVLLTALSLGSCPQPQTSRGIVGLSSSAFGGCRHAWRNRTLDTASEVCAPLAQLSSSRAAPGSSRSGRARRDRWPSSKGCRHCRHAADAAAVRVGGRQAPCAGVWPVLEQGWLRRRSRSPPQRPVTEIPHTANPRLRTEAWPEGETYRCAGAVPSGAPQGRWCPKR